MSRDEALAESDGYIDKTTNLMCCVSRCAM